MDKVTIVGGGRSSPRPRGYSIVGRDGSSSEDEDEDVQHRSYSPGTSRARLSPPSQQPLPYTPVQLSSPSSRLTPSLSPATTAAGADQSVLGLDLSGSSVHAVHAVLGKPGSRARQKTYLVATYTATLDSNDEQQDWFIADDWPKPVQSGLRQGQAATSPRTDATVWIELGGSNGKSSGPRLLARGDDDPFLPGAIRQESSRAWLISAPPADHESDGGEKFAAGSVDEFAISCDDLGDVTTCRVWHDNDGADWNTSRWKLAKVVVTCIQHHAPPASIYSSTESGDGALSYHTAGATGPLWFGRRRRRNNIALERLSICCGEAATIAYEATLCCAAPKGDYRSSSGRTRSSYHFTTIISPSMQSGSSHPVTHSSIHPSIPRIGFYPVTIRFGWLSRRPDIYSTESRNQ